MLTYEKKLPTLQKKEKTDKTNNKYSSNLTGIPYKMKSQYENRSGLYFDDVRVHYNSDKPAKLRALAYTQGNQIYIGPGQERHLGHELSHVVQQKQGLVRPTSNFDGIPINDDINLEKDADDLRPVLNKAQIKNNNIEKSSVIQMVGERAALQSTMKGSGGKGLRRGNVRYSIIDTNMESTYKVTKLRTEKNKLCEEIKKELLEKDKQLFINKNIDDLDKLIKAEIILAAGVANCGEFSSVVYSHLLCNTEDQYVYRCHLLHCDHSFTITSKNELRTKEKKIIKFLNINGKSMIDKKIHKVILDKTNISNVVVVDGWFGYTICSLKEFCAKNNPTDKKLNAYEDIGLDYGKKADRSLQLNDEQKKMIKEKVEERLLIKQDEFELYKSKFDINNKNYWGGIHEKVERKVNDTRTTAEIQEDILNTISNLMKQNNLIEALNQLVGVDTEIFEAAIKLIGMAKIMPLEYNDFDGIADEVIRELFLEFENEEKKVNYLFYLLEKNNKNRINMILEINNKLSDLFNQQIKNKEKNDNTELVGEDYKNIQGTYLNGIQSYANSLPYTSHVIRGVAPHHRRSSNNINASLNRQNQHRITNVYASVRANSVAWNHHNHLVERKIKTKNKFF